MELFTSGSGKTGKLELRLLRKWYTGKSTVGELYIGKGFECYTLEDVVRPAKIAGQTAIPAGMYKITIDQSARFNRLMPLLLDVVGFEGVRIHSGNTDKDTEGCILVGQEHDPGKPDFIGRSVLAFDALFAKLEAAVNGGREIWIKVADAK